MHVEIYNNQDGYIKVLQYINGHTLLMENLHPIEHLDRLVNELTGNGFTVKKYGF